MSLVDEIDALPRGARKSTECKVCYELRSETPEGRAAINAALVAGTRYSEIAAVLVRNGYDVTAENVMRHFKRGHSL